VLGFTTGLAPIGALRIDQKERFTMGTFGCGCTTDPKKNFNGTHRVMQAVKADILKDLEASGFTEASAHVKGEKPKSMAFQITNKEI
jgi:hypothetical protein